MTFAHKMIYEKDHLLYLGIVPTFPTDSAFFRRHGNEAVKVLYCKYFLVKVQMCLETRSHSKCHAM